MHNLLRNIFLSASGDKIELKGCYWSETITFLVFLHFYTKTRDKDVTHIRIRKQKYNNQELKLTCHVISPHNGEGFGFPTAYGLTQIFFFFLFFFNISWTGEATMPLRLHASPPLRGGQTLQYRRMKGGLYEWLQAPGSKRIEEAGREKLKEGAADVNSSGACIIATPGPGAVQGGQRCAVYHYKVPS